MSWYSLSANEVSHLLHVYQTFLQAASSAACCASEINKKSHHSGTETSNIVLLWQLNESNALMQRALAEGDENALAQICDSNTNDTADALAASIARRKALVRYA